MEKLQTENWYLARNSTEDSPSPRTRLIDETLLVALTEALNVLFCFFVGLGILTNMVNILVFYKMSLTSTSNLSFFTLSIADLNFLVFGLLGSFQASRVTVGGATYHKLAQIPGQLSRSCSAFGSWVTAVINVERSCCIVFPIQVRFIFTRRTVTCMFLAMVLYEVATATAFFSVLRLRPPHNKSSTRTVYVLYKTDKAQATLSAFLAFSLPTFLCFIVVVIGTAFLVVKFRESRRTRKSLTRSKEGGGSKATERRDARVVSTVIVICVIYIVGFTPSVAKYALSAAIPDFDKVHPYYRDLVVLWQQTGLLFQTVSASINILVYLRMNSNFRNTFKGICSKRE